MNKYEFKKWRQEQYLTMRDLAMILDVHENTVQNWEAGRCRIPGMAELAFEAITQRRASLVRKLRKAREQLAHQRRLKAIAQGVWDERPPGKPVELPPGVEVEA